MQFAYTQNTKATQEQKEKISKIFTPDYVIQSSKPISIMKQQDSVIKARDNQIKELLNKIEALKTEHKNTLVEIAKQNSIVKKNTKKVDSISNSQLDKLRPGLFSQLFSKTAWSNFHGYIGAEVPDFTNFGNTNLNAELMFEFRKVDFGIKGEIRIQDNQINPAIRQNILFFKVRYKIF